MNNLIFIRSLISLTLLFMANYCYGQECKDFYKSDFCYVYVPLDREFKLYNQAKSTLVGIDKPITHKIILYGGKDYIVGVCSEGSYYRSIRLKIIDGVTKKVLYDNIDYDFIESFILTVEKTQPIEMEVTVISKENVPPKENVCVGFQILYGEPVILGEK